MDIQFTGHNVEVTDGLKETTHSKFERLLKHTRTITNIHVIFEVDKLRQIAEAKLLLPGTEVHAKAESEQMYKTIDALVDKLVRQLEKHKGKQSDH